MFEYQMKKNSQILEKCDICYGKYEQQYGIMKKIEKRNKISRRKDVH